jgi:hypothetical protein
MGFGFEVAAGDTGIETDEELGSRFIGSSSVVESVPVTIDADHSVTFTHQAVRHCRPDPATPVMTVPFSHNCKSHL